MQDGQINKQYNEALSAQSSFVAKTAVSFAAAVLCAVLSLSGVVHTVTALTELICAVAVFFVCRDEISDGIVSMLEFQPTNDALNTMAFVTSCINAIYGVFAEYTPFAGAAYMSLFVSMLMKLLYVHEITSNLDFIKDKNIYGIGAEKVDLRKRYIQNVCTVKPINRIPNLLRLSSRGDPSVEKIRSFVPCVSIISLLSAIVVATFIGMGHFTAALAAMFAVTASFTSEMAFVLPYLLSQHRLRKYGSILMGYHSIEALRNTSTLTVDDRELFPPDRMRMEAFRFEATEFLAKAVEYTASLLIESDSPLKEEFCRTIASSEQRLPFVKDWKFIKNYGIKAHIYDDEVLLGNRNLLLSYGAKPLPQEKEVSVITSNKSLMYIAINGKLAAYMIYSCHPDPNMKKAAENIGGDFSIIVNTSDCGITENMVQKRYDMHSTRVIIPDADESELLRVMQENTTAEEKPSMITTKNSLGILSSVRIAKKLLKLVDMNTITKIGSVILGLVLTLVGFIMAPGYMSLLWIILFNMLWAVPVVVISLIKQ